MVAKLKKKPVKGKTATSATGVKGKTLGKREQLKFYLDCSAPVQDNIVETSRMEKFFRDRIKVDGEVGQLAGKIDLHSDKGKIHINSEVRFPKRYIKYLAKKYLKKQQLRDFLRVVATSKGGYELRYFVIS